MAWDAQNGKWQGSLWVGVRRVHVGNFGSEREAAVAVLARQRELGLDPDRRQASEFRGVAWHKRGQKWRMTINIGGKQHHLGSFGAGHPGEVDVALAFEATGRALGPDGRSGGPRTMPASAPSSR